MGGKRHSLQTVKIHIHKRKLKIYIYIPTTKTFRMYNDTKLHNKKQQNTQENHNLQKYTKKIPQNAKKREIIPQK